MGARTVILSALGATLVLLAVWTLATGRHGERSATLAAAHRHAVERGSGAEPESARLAVLADAQSSVEPGEQDSPSGEQARRAPEQDELAAAVAWLRESRPEPYGTLTREVAAELAELDLTGAALEDEDLRHLRALPALRSLNLRGTPITDAGLAHLAGLAELTFLELRGTKVSALGLPRLPTNLETLKLSDTAVAGRDLPLLPAMPELRKLSLNFLNLGDVDVDALNAYPSLRHLELDRSTVSAAGLERILALNPELTRVEVRNTAVTKEDVARLSAAHPSCVFVQDSW
jgi:hypothetical protein